MSLAVSVADKIVHAPPRRLLAAQAIYRSVNTEGNTLDRRRRLLEDVFPEQAPVVYIQKNSFSWDDRRRYQAAFAGVLRDRRIYWDTEILRGYGWDAGPRVLPLELERKGAPGARFYAIIAMDAGKRNHVRTWRWFRNGKCHKRTLGDEKPVG